MWLRLHHGLCVPHVAVESSAAWRRTHLRTHKVNKYLENFFWVCWQQQKMATIRSTCQLLNWFHWLTSPEVNPMISTKGTNNISEEQLTEFHSKKRNHNPFWFKDIRAGSTWYEQLWSYQLNIKTSGGMKMNSKNEPFGAGGKTCFWWFWIKLGCFVPKGRYYGNHLEGNVTTQFDKAGQGRI